MTITMLIDEVCEYVSEAAEFDFESPFAALLLPYPHAPLEAIVDGALTSGRITNSEQVPLRSWCRAFEQIRAEYLIQTGKWLHYARIGEEVTLTEAKLPLNRDSRRS